MIIVHTRAELQTILKPEYFSGRNIGFVPTMGALHEGHISLVKASVAQNPVTVASIFVNPTQFGPNEDFEKYPRDLQKDANLLSPHGVDIVFAPSAEEIYPFPRRELVMRLESMDKILCGAKRPGHFDGVLQVVSRLFHIVQPQKAYFGTKDYQQLAIIRRMVEELFFPVEVIGCPIVREMDGLAMSSRNAFLSAEERLEALFLSKCLQAMKSIAQPGMEVRQLLDKAQAMIPQYPLIRPDYIEIRHGETLQEVKILRPEDRPIGLVAAFCGNTRLIDNLFLFS